VSETEKTFCAKATNPQIADSLLMSFYNFAEKGVFMFKQPRLFFSAIIIAMFFVSTLTTDISAKNAKCPIELPKSILSLYLQSDTVVIADFRNENIVKTEDEDENGYYADIKRNLDVVKTFKGQKLPEISFIKSEYRQTAKAGENAANKDDADYPEYEMDNLSDNLTVGKRYLIFLKKDNDSDGFLTADYRFFSREINQENVSAYEKSLTKLSKILANKKNQLPNLAEWLVALTENEITRWDGATTLARSFASLKYEEGETETEATPSIDSDFNEYSVTIAKHITKAQKERLSSTFVNSLNQSLLGGEKIADYDYDLAELVGNWDRERFAMYGYSLLLAIDKSDVKKTSRAMNFVANTINDNDLSAIYFRYTEVRDEDEIVPDKEAVNDPPVQINEPPIEKTEQNPENITETLVTKEQIQTETTPPEDEIMTQAQIREQLLQRFANRYQELLARNFAPEPETEVTEIITR
jgi:hypothetical protein